VKNITIDFETYYDREYSLSKMSTEDYITDPRFDVILVGAKVDDSAVEWVSGSKKQTAAWLAQLDIPNSAITCHNAMFDATILQHVFGLRPKFIFDTISMAQAQLRPFIKSVSLKSCLEHCDFDGFRKGDEVHNMLGRTRQSLNPKELASYAQYCCDDVTGTRLLFQHLKPLFPRTEFIVMDMTHRMYLDPMFELDANLLAEVLAEERAKKEALLASLDSYCSKADLMSNEKFALALQKAGATPPRKLSLTTGKETWAFAKGDQAWKEFEEEYEDHPLVSAMCAARLGVKSTLAENRAERLLEIATRHRQLRVPLNYYAAHTGRYGGTQKINMQNPPRIDKSRIRFAMRAPKGYVCLAADLAQIEARIVAWLAGCDVLTHGFRNMEDVYAAFATAAFKIPTKKGRSKEDDRRRFVGKTCILGLGYGMGAEKLMATLRKDGIKIDLAEAQRLVNTYRSLYMEIPHLWGKFERLIPLLASGEGRTSIKPPKTEQAVCWSGKNMIALPNTMPMYYNNLSHEGDWFYTFGYEKRKLFGGKLCENVVQALARIVVVENMLTISRELGLQPKLQVHDELDYIVPERDAVRYADEIKKIMSVPPSWAPGLPVAVEVAYGPTFGDCK
jgi:DNA polymerase I-like protein with 3'-5' exonuclease and polymerase domains